MKTKIHIATKEYCFIEYEVENETLDKVVYLHDELVTLLEKEGHNQTDWARIRNKYVLENIIEVEDFEGCSRSQKYFINQMKLVWKSRGDE